MQKRKRQTGHPKQQTANVVLLVLTCSNLLTILFMGSGWDRRVKAMKFSQALPLEHGPVCDEAGTACRPNFSFGFIKNWCGGALEPTTSIHWNL
mmetsp:Transcript_14898/g.26107  ORF Transcript_14898/g.26107 Transcript_14898/m.26107 type:complete len:94 (-) Transcript_14898:652-933(-)